MTLTPRHQPIEQDGRVDSPCAAAAVDGGVLGCDGPTYSEILGEMSLDLSDRALAALFERLSDLPDEALEVDGPDEEALGARAGITDSSATVRESATDDQASVDRWGGRSLWDASAVDPEAKAEMQRLAAQLDVERAEWMRMRAEESEAERSAEYAAYLERNPEIREQREREDEEWRKLLDDFDARTAEKARVEAERAERRREIARNSEPAVDAHPLLDQYRRSDLKGIAPELSDGIDGLKELLGQLHSFERPMGPDEAVTVMDGLEALNRLSESISIVTLSVFERVGTPRDYGAKTTQALIQNRLSLSEREAKRRTDLAKELGKRVNYSGESIDPKFAVVSEALLGGILSANQAGAIVKCLQDLSSRVDEMQLLEAECILVEKAPSVRVRDIFVLYKEILGWLDPDGARPEEAADRDSMSVNLRQMKDGTWSLKGRLDEEAGGILNGLLTSRIKTEEEKASRGTAAKVEESTSGASDEDVVEAYAEVLRGDRCDCLDPSLDFSVPPPFALDTDEQSPASEQDTASDRQRGDDGTGDVPQGFGVREDGSLVEMAGRQPSVRRRIYERFASLIGSIEMDRIKAGAAYALVVTAKAEDLARQSGRAVTGTEAPFPIGSAAREGLNGSVFFHLMGEQTKTMQVATENRLANAKQLTILSSRDQGCTFPGCDTPPGWCEAHHIVPWADEGRTDINNLTLACGAHHRLIDQTDWYAVMLKDGRPAWVPPATVDPARLPILHARFIAREIGETLFG